MLFPPAAALTTPQLAAAIACPASTALFDSLVRRRYGDDAWLASLWFGVATTTSLFTGRLTFAFGLLPAVGTALALQRRRPGLAVGLAVLTALASPVDALFAALAGAAYAVAEYLRDPERRQTRASPGSRWWSGRSARCWRWPSCSPRAAPSRSRSRRCGRSW